MRVDIEYHSLKHLKSLEQLSNKINEEDKKQILKNIKKAITKNENRLKNYFEIFKSFRKNEVKEKLKVITEVPNLDECFLKKLQFKFATTEEDIIRWFSENQTKFRLDETLMLSRTDKTDLLDKLMYSNPFVPYNCIKYLEETTLKYLKYIDEEEQIELHIFEKKLKLDINKILQIINSMRKITGDNRKLTIVFGMTPFRKEYVKELNQNSINPVSINSGSSYKTRYINLWRYEEWEKVLIHELCHFLDLDFMNITSGADIVQKKVRELIKIVGVCNPFESYTETCACLLNSIYSCANIDKFEYLEKFIFFETLFSIKQCLKFMHYLNCKDINCLKIHQKTSVISYFFLKTSLLLNLEEFLNFLNENLNFGSERKRFEDYSNLLDESFKKLNLLNNLTVKFDDNNLRMTILALN